VIPSDPPHTFLVRVRPSRQKIAEWTLNACRRMGRSLRRIADRLDPPGVVKIEIRTTGPLDASEIAHHIDWALTTARLVDAPSPTIPSSQEPA